MWRVPCESCGKVRDCRLFVGFVVCGACAEAASPETRPAADDLHPRWVLEGIAVDGLRPGGVQPGLW